MKKKIWILNHYAGNMFYDRGGRHYWFAKYLRRAGYEPVVFCCNAKHNAPGKFIQTDELWVEQYEEEIGVPFVFVKGRVYTGNGKQRVLNMLDFYGNVKKTMKQYAKQNCTPNIILASSVHPLTLVAGIKMAKKFDIKCICEMRDLWPEAIVAYSRKLKKMKLLTGLLYKGERWIYKKADALIFTQEGGADYIKAHKWDLEQGGPIDLSKAYHINNGVDLEAFDANKEKFRLDDADLDDKNAYKVIYAGAIRRINNLGIIVDAAKKITNERIRFIIYGNGEELEVLKQRLQDENIRNVVFKGYVNKQYIPSVVSRADLNLVHWEMNPLLRVGESYNKAFEYFAAGRPVFYTVRPGYSIVEKYKCGKLTDGFAAEDLAKGIEMLAGMSEEESAEMSVNARKAAEIYDFKEHTKRLIEIVESL